MYVYCINWDLTFSAASKLDYEKLDKLLERMHSLTEVSHVLLVAILTRLGLTSNGNQIKAFAGRI